MKRYLVEVRLGYDVRADSADEALKLVSSGLQDDETIAVEYSVRERHEACLLYTSDVYKRQSQ